ncbi:hypothetical protein QJQ45_004403 [Haematococcus lacustris]|nr:hypothetical protein QJQ45_004403 [Haematococcus lacustris]
MAEVSMQRHGRAKQLVVFFGAAGIGTRGGWGADAVLRACCKVVCRPRGTDQRRGRVVLVDEHRTSRVSSAVNGQQPCERQLNKRRATRPADWKPPAGQVQQRLLRPAWSQQRDQPVRGMMWCPVVAPRKPPQPPNSSQAATQAAASEPGPSTPLPAKRSKHTKAEPAAEPTKGKGKAAKAKPAPQPGRWLDRDCNAALNMQRIGESKWRPLELCYWPQQGALPAKGKEYPGLGYKRVRDKPPKAQQQQPAEAQASGPGRHRAVAPGRAPAAAATRADSHALATGLAPAAARGGGAGKAAAAVVPAAGTSLEANLKHITVTLATWDTVWEVYLDPKWVRQWLRLYAAQDRLLEQFFKAVRTHIQPLQRYGTGPTASIAGCAQRDVHGGGFAVAAIDHQLQGGQCRAGEVEVQHWVLGKLRHHESRRQRPEDQFVGVEALAMSSWNAEPRNKSGNLDLVIICLVCHQLAP